MTPEEIIFNRKCTEFLEWNKIDSSYEVYNIPVSFNFGYLPDGHLLLEALRFHMDYNWLMFVKHKICSIPNVVEDFIIRYDKTYGGYWGNLVLNHESFESCATKIYQSEIEVLIELINIFLDFYKKYKYIF